MLVGLTGYAGAGKDEVAKSLRLRAGFYVMGMSDALHEMAMVLDPLLQDESGLLSRYSDLTARFGYTEAKNIPAYREFLQRLGTEGVREIINQEAWVWAAERKFQPMLAEGKNVAITAIRFPNEASMVKRWGGEVVRVVRNGVGPVNSHTSDTAMDDIAVDFVIHNHGSLADLSRHVQEYVISRNLV